MLDGFQRLRSIVNDPALTPAQKAHALAVQAENLLAYPALDPETRDALDARIICDMYEGAAPYRPRYVLADFSVVLEKGSCWLELPPPETLDDALNTLMIAYHHVPSITGMPVYIGQLDALLLPFCAGVSDDELYSKIKRFWRYIDRVLPDAFLHANIGPTDNAVARAILRVDAELKQIAPNLTLFYDPAVSTEALLAQAVTNITECSKPHIANHPIHAATFDEAGYGIVSCYNALPLRGGASTLARVNLREVALRAKGIEHFLGELLPRYVETCFNLMQARIDYLYDESGFFESFLVTEGWIDRDRFTAMFGVFGMAEAVDILQGKAGLTGRYGHDQNANALGLRITEALAAMVEARPMRNVWRGRAMLHAQAGLSTDSETTPGIRIAYGTEPDPVAHVQALAPQHRYYASGVSEILTLDETVKANPAAVLQLCKGAFASGFREFTANVASNDLVRVTGYMIRLSDVARQDAGEGSRTNTTALGAEAAKLTGILARKPRVVGQELDAGQRQ
ncbi:MAG: YjjI family glycine radical enzyme [Phaeovulum sp.]|uniref:YjjI family glycine radical enzyme n=1 Tax=Phaeovulum sp. TaxID=2934796 RepID=UPI0027307022|nr:YjjI family glycine radical enzyme [Phaeovulum sp.]MDP2063450.1 YjjI family glycine radical enzyme [Phaeovulum sp.]MDP3861764.1 YjjI family glycine radical enzyme [Phaeovulum sp.]